MKKFDNIYNTLINQANTYIILEAEGGTEIEQPSQDTKQAQQQKKSGSTYDWISQLILPTLLGVGSTSLLFGQGLFGLGKTNSKTGKAGIFGGWGGQAIGGLGLLALLPGLWSSKGIGDRFTDSFSKLSSGNIGGFFKELAGISPAADSAIQAGQQQAAKAEESAEAIEQRKNKYINTSESGKKIFKWLERSGYKCHNLNIINDDISCFLISPRLDNEKRKYGNKECIAVVVSTDKGAQCAMCDTNQIVSLINQKFAGELRAAFTKKQEGNGFGNPNLTQSRERGLAALAYLSKLDSQNADQLLGKIEWLNKGLRSLDVQDLNYTEEMFGGLSKAVQIGILLELSEDQDILKEQTEGSVEDIANDLKKDESIKDMKSDPVLNKFDQKLQKIQRKIEDINIQTLMNSIDQANEKDPTAYIIEGKIGDKTYYYARKPDNNYLTDKIEETIFFDKQTVEKLEGSGDPKLKLQHTLQEIHMPQIMKMKNSGLKLYIKPINVKYLQKVSQLLKKHNISL